MARSSGSVVNAPPPNVVLASSYVALLGEFYVSHTALLDGFPQGSPVLWQVRFDLHFRARQQAPCRLKMLLRANRLHHVVCVACVINLDHPIRYLFRELTCTRPKAQMQKCEKISHQFHGQYVPHLFTLTLVYPRAPST